MPFVLQKKKKMKQRAQTEKSCTLFNSLSFFSVCPSKFQKSCSFRFDHCRGVAIIWWSSSSLASLKSDSTVYKVWGRNTENQTFYGVMRKCVINLKSSLWRPVGLLSTGSEKCGKFGMFRKQKVGNKKLKSWMETALSRSSNICTSSCQEQCPKFHEYKRKNTFLTLPILTSH